MRNKTNTKEFCRKVQETILKHFDDFESMQNEINHYYKTFGYKYAKTMVEYGCFDCYYSDCAESIAKWFNITVEETWHYYKEDTEKLWQWYIYFISREIEHMQFSVDYDKLNTILKDI